MKRILIAMFLFGSVALLGGCCTDDMCNMGTTYTKTSACSSCNKCNTCSTCSTCGYDASYTYSGWY